MPQPSNDNPFQKYARFSAIVVEMIAIIFGCVYLGVWLDDKLNIKFPVFTVVLSLFGVFAAIFLLIKQIPRE
ncbi:MAG TPA: AtpZ/AtpI family protein [Bacteroidales bacterium]|nr:AtpZ/AtpI family protein [Bacteroidales bacterium]